MSNKEWVRAGIIQVDAGQCWIGDPVMMLTDRTIEERLMKTNLNVKSPVQKYAFDDGIKGLGVMVRSGFGDGVYPVYIKKEDGVVTEMKVVFLE